jgi:hypothetical protein
VTCQHCWIATRGHIWRTVTCGQCFEVRRVRPRWRHPVPHTTGEGLGEAIDRGVISNDEVTWRGRHLR